MAGQKRRDNPNQTPILATQDAEERSYGHGGYRAPMNLIDFEISTLPANDLLKGPDIVEAMSLGHKYREILEGRVKSHPVTGCHKYLLFSMKDSVTNWHVDFTATSVCYSVLAGRKIIMFLPPTRKNMRLLRAWEEMSDGGKHSFNFFGTLAGVEGHVRAMDLRAGDIVFIPGQMLHFVVTVEDSIVLGQNFLTDVHLSRSLAAYADEVNRFLPADEVQPCFLPMMLCHLATAYHYGNSVQHIRGELHGLIQCIDAHLDKRVIANLLAAVSKFS